MKFLLKKDLNLLLEEHIIDQLTCDNDELLNQSEAKALETCYEWLDSRYDMDFELRPYSDYVHSNVYSDLERIRVSQSEENDAFGELYGLDLLSSGVTSALTSDFILAKTINACELPYNTYCESKWYNDLVNYYVLDSRFSPQLNNPDMTFTGSNVNYSDTCGQFEYSATTDGSTITQEQYETLLSGGTVTGVTLTSETFSYGETLNYYNTEYFETTGSTGTTILDYNQKNLVSGLTPDNFYGDISYFDQYIKSNESRDWAEDDRNSTLVDIVASITIYELVRRASPRLMNEVIADGYDISMQKLQNARKGKITLRLKEKKCAEEKGLGYGMRFGQNNISIRNKY